MEVTIGEILKQMNLIEDVSSTSIRSLEMEKEKLKLEVGSRSSVTINEVFDASSLWQAVSLLSAFSSVASDTVPSSGDIASARTFEAWVRGRIENLQKLVTTLPSATDLTSEIESIRKLLVLQEKVTLSNQETHRQKISTLESKVRALELQSSSSVEFDFLEKRIAALEAKEVSRKGKVFDGLPKESLGVDDFDSRMKALEGKLNELNPDRESTAVRFNHIFVKNLNDMRDFLQFNIPTLHFGLPADFHLVMEHVNQNINPVKPALDHLQNLCKLEIPTTNHSLAITALETKEPKFCFKAKEYQVTKKN